MKKIYLFIPFLFLIGCSSSIPVSKLSKKILDCPPILYASEHRVYMGSSSNDISLDNLAYKANINNAIFLDKCFIENNTMLVNLSILFVIEPLVEFNKDIKLPYYLAVLDKNENILAIEFFSIEGKFNRDQKTKDIIETELVDNIKFDLKDKNSSVIIGFMIDKKRIGILK